MTYHFNGLLVLFTNIIIILLKLDQRFLRYCRLNDGMFRILACCIIRTVHLRKKITCLLLSSVLMLYLKIPTFVFLSVEPEVILELRFLRK